MKHRSTSCSRMMGLNGVVIAMYDYSAVLCIGTDPQLLELRCQVLATRFTLVASSTLPNLQDALKYRHFDLLVLCHTVSTPDCAAAIRLFRACCSGAAVIAMRTHSPGCSESEIDASVFALAGPPALFRAIDNLTHHGKPRFGLLHGTPVRPMANAAHLNAQERLNYGQVQHLG